MKTKCLIAICAFALLASQNPSPAAPHDPGMVAVDALLVRPVGLVSTIVGGAIWVVALPIAAITGSVKSSQKALIGAPARYTFERQLGDLEDYGD